MTEDLTELHDGFLIGVKVADLPHKSTTEAILGVVGDYQEHGHDLWAMAYYDGYIRRKYGLVDSEGYET